VGKTSNFDLICQIRSIVNDYSIEKIIDITS
jgi:hypothetical protein